MCPNPPRAHALQANFEPGPQVSTVTPTDLAALLHEDDAPLVLDVRGPGAFVGPRGHIAGASPFDVERLETELGELEGFRNRRFVVVCEDGRRAPRAATVLLTAGFERVAVLEGGMAAWRDAGLPVRT